MGKRLILVAALMAAFSPLAGCAGGSLLNSYLIDDASVGGDPGRTLNPVKGVLVWPLENIASGSKSKGIETRFSGVLSDTVMLHGSFDQVVVLEEDQAKDLMNRAGEELGLKKKPKTPSDGALVATKLGQLTGTDVILTGRIEDYDEDKVDKATITVVSASFNVLDAREKAYTTLDSFAPVKRIWRTNAKRVSQEGPFNSREGLDDTARALMQDVVERMAVNLSYGANVSEKILKIKAAELNDAAEKSYDAGDYDKAIAGWNEVLKIQPDNKKPRKRIEAAEKAKLEAQEKAKAEALRIQTEEIREKAQAAAKAGDLEAAIVEWNKILALDKGDKEAVKSIRKLEEQLSERKKKEAEEAEKKAAADRKAREEAEKKAAAERKAREEAEKMDSSEVVKPAEAPKVVEEPKALEPPKVVEEPKAVEPPKVVEEPKAVEPPKVVEEPKAVEAPKMVEKITGEVKPSPVSGGDIEAVRNQAMSAFNKEDYAASRDLWMQILATSPDDKQAREMLETTEMLLNALK